MDFFRVISPNKLRLSCEECQKYLTGDEDPMLSVSSKSGPNELKFLQEDLLPTSASRLDQGADNLAGQVRIDDPIIQRWLLENFEMAEGQSIARADMYRLFCDLCQSNGLVPCNQALFGKTVHNTFPLIKTRRIGVRNNSRYHYTGISSKLTSNVSEQLLLIRKNGDLSSLQHTGTNHCSPGQAANISPCQEGTLQDPNMGSDHLITSLLPHFPTTHSVTVADDLADEVSLLLSLYRYLALDILTAVMKTQFTKLQEITSVFWKNVPNSIYSHLTEESLMSVIVTCDRQIYAAMLGLLVPNILVRIPNSMSELLQISFGRQYQQMIERSLQACPYTLRCKKMQETRRFCKRLSHRLSVCKLCGQVREILGSDSKVLELRRHVAKIDVAHIAVSTEFAVRENGSKGFKKRIQSGLQLFQQLLRQRAQLESYTRWIKMLLYQNLRGDGCGRGDDYASTARVVYLELSFIVALVGRELSAGRASPNAQITYHMLEMFFISYLRYLLETELKQDMPKHYSKLPVIS